MKVDNVNVLSQSENITSFPGKCDWGKCVMSGQEQENAFPSSLLRQTERLVSRCRSHKVGLTWIIESSHVQEPPWNIAGTKHPLCR